VLISHTHSKFFKIKALLKDLFDCTFSWQAKRDGYFTQRGALGQILSSAPAAKSIKKAAKCRFNKNITCFL